MFFWEREMKKESYMERKPQISILHNWTEERSKSTKEETTRRLSQTNLNGGNKLELINLIHTSDLDLTIYTWSDPGTAWMDSTRTDLMTPSQILMIQRTDGN